PYEGDLRLAVLAARCPKPGSHESYARGRRHRRQRGLDRGWRTRLLRRRRSRSVICRIGPVAFAGTDLHTWTFDADRNRMKLAIELRLRGRVPEQVIPARVAHDLLHPDVEIVTVQNRAAVGFERKSPQRVERSSQKLAVRLRADGLVDIELERRQAARV